MSRYLGQSTDLGALRGATTIPLSKDEVVPLQKLSEQTIELTSLLEWWYEEML
ncbi:562_t:CDS:2 [Acaulospora colombiana]|uniref:562_t:CDS:1 n=1 Tax=Acaulospora colombiana TaxID=27376 RepID=A0ACA9R6I7_9GLOM|nr:562_t:CDS:2 [Acaulospora colombiana]